MKGKPHPLVGIVILNWNGLDHTLACLESLQEIEYSNYQIWVVDNHSEKDELGQVLSEFPAINPVQNIENLGFSGGNNVGIRHALAAGVDYVLLLNNDTVVERNFLTELIANVKTDSVLQPMIMKEPNRDQTWNGGGAFNSVVGWSQTRRRALKNSLEQTDWLTGCCILVPAKGIENVGLLDERYFAYKEDVDWSLRFRRAGFQLLVCRDSIIYHKAGMASKSENREGVVSAYVHYLNVRNQLFVIRSHVPQFFQPLAIGIHLGRSLTMVIYFAVRLRFGKLRAVVRGFLHGLGH